MMKSILLGAQASGKGTQAALLAQRYAISHISSGDLFREEISQGTGTGRMVQEYIARGELVPDDLTVALVLRRLQQADCRYGFLLDGFPRTLAQAQILDQEMALQGKQIETVMYLEVDREKLYRRIAGRLICRDHQHVYNIHSNPPRIAGICDLDGSELYQRFDDRGEAVRSRLDSFFSLTICLLNYYEMQGKLIRVNGDQGIEQVHQTIANRLHLPALLGSK